MSDEYASGTPAGFKEKAKGKTLAQEFQQLDSKKLSMYRRCEEYATWTLPYVFPVMGIKDQENQGASDSTGAMAVNNLSNKVTMTLFQPNSPFFRLTASNKVLTELKKAAEDGDTEAGNVLATIDQRLADAEKDAMQALNYNRFRTEATNVVKSLIITGNALMYHPENGKVQSYGFRDYVISRDLSGTVIRIITRDKKAFYTFKEEVQKLLRAGNNGKKYKDNCDVTVYTKIEMNAEGKYDLTQAADDVPLDTKATYTAEDLPYITLTWNLVRGEDYGRGLVEDYAGSFHALYVLNSALVDMVGITSDIKFLVDPGSTVDVQKLNDSESGSYHSGKEGDVTTVQLNKIQDIQIVENAVARYANQIARAFLMNSSVPRDAERVTAEEIRYVAQELELAHAGTYSRFAEEWQLRVAILMLKTVNISIGKGKSLYPQIITGLDTLSRAGDLDNLRMMIADLQLLEAVPDDIRAAINPLKFAAYVGIRRGVDYEKFIYTAPEMQQRQQAQQAQEAQAMQMEAGAGVAAAVGKEAVKQQ